MIFFVGEGIPFSLTRHPICLPTESNVDTKKWNGENVDVVGFAVSDFAGTKGDRMKVANMEIYTQDYCNARLQDKLNKHKECKSHVL